VELRNAEFRRLGYESFWLLKQNSFHWRFPLADTIDVQVTGKSEPEVAHQMAMHLLVSVQGAKSLKDVTRSEYLNAHVDAIYALRGSRPG